VGPRRVVDKAHLAGFTPVLAGARLLYGRLRIRNPNDPRAVTGQGRSPLSVQEMAGAVSRERGLSLPSSCIDDETLAGYADGSLGDQGRTAVDEHVDRCHACRRLLAAVGASSDGGDLLTTSAPPGQKGERLG